MSGLSTKFWLPNSQAIQVVFGAWGWNHGYGYGPGVSPDYLFEMPSIARSRALDLGWNLGFGGTVVGVEPPWVGASGVAGIEFNFRPAPIDVTLEYRPGVALVPDVYVDLVNFTGHALSRRRVGA